jgi:hypothetical protein
MLARSEVTPAMVIKVRLGARLRGLRCRRRRRLAWSSCRLGEAECVAPDVLGHGPEEMFLQAQAG